MNWIIFVTKMHLKIDGFINWRLLSASGPKTLILFHAFHAPQNFRKVSTYNPLNGFF